MAAARGPIGRLTCAVLSLAALTAISVEISSSQPPAHERRMSFHNRLLLNRAAISGLRSIEVLLLVNQAGTPAERSRAEREVPALVNRLGGHVSRQENAIGYLRVEVPIDRLVELAASPAIDAYQISSLSKGAWYRDTPPMANAQMFRGFEVTPIAAVEPAVTHPDLPVLTPMEAREPGFTADDVGVGQWLTEHPTFDGRGVTIAILENALPSFADPTLRMAKTLDGQDIPKVAGILNVLDSTQPDDTRVRLDTKVEAVKSWTSIGGRTYILPRPGSYRFGTLELPGGANVIHRFGVLEDTGTGEIRIDANGDASFQDEPPLADVNERFDPRVLQLAYPRQAQVSFVMGRGREPHVVHIYIGKGSHQSMTVSVAAGSRTDESLASGVAPNARVLLVRVSSSDTGPARLVEGCIEAAQRPDVDVIGTSFGVAGLPDSTADFAGALIGRLAAVYHKPIVHSANNSSLMLATAHAVGGGLSVGGILSPQTWNALYGGRRLEELVVHPMSAAGPSLDGAIKPDFLAPMERLAADLPWNTGAGATPRHAPTRRIPPGYQISCCTSSTSPYAAGVAALLISAARQSKIQFTGDSIRRAMTLSARAVPGFQAHQQGNGALDINAAWTELARAADPPRIVATAGIVHPLAQYAARGLEGEGILEVEGWRQGMTGTRDITLRRDSGPAQPVSYRLDWTAGDGTFRTAPSVTLPLGTAVPLRIRIDVTSAGVHSGILNLRDTMTNAAVFRTQATIVAAEPFDPATRSIRVTGRVGLMRQRAHYFDVPAGAGGIEFELEVTRGVVRPSIVPATGLFPQYYLHVHPDDVHYAGKGRYHVILPNPTPGTWAFYVNTGSTWFQIPGDPVPGDDADAEYGLTVRLLESSIRASMTPSGTVVADIENTGSMIGEPVLQASPGYLTSHDGSFLPNGLPNTFDIELPRDAATLSLQLHSEREGTRTELFLYDCTTGECFSYNIGFPAARAHTLVVRKPNAGRWVAAVNAAPFPSAAGAFVLDELVTTGSPVRRTSAAARGPGARWRETIENVAPPPSVPGKTPVLLIELLDTAMEGREIDHPWSTAPTRLRLRDRPVALGTTIYRR